jgi:hypothetical protein
VSELLVYQTSDPRFADKAIDAMEAAGIPCFQTGHGWVDPGLTRQGLGEGICIYIRDEKDAPRASQTLIGLGAATETPIRLPSQRISGSVHGIDHRTGKLCGYALGIERTSQTPTGRGERVRMRRRLNVSQWR